MLCKVLRGDCAFLCMLMLQSSIGAWTTALRLKLISFRSLMSSTNTNSAIMQAAPTSLPLSGTPPITSSKNNEKMVVVLAGPTAVGKSDVAAKLCNDRYGIIVSADSVQAYRGVQIGANKPDQAEREKTPHILLDVADAETKYNAAEWRHDAIHAIQRLLLLEQNVSQTMDADMDEQEVLEAKERQSAIDAEIEKAKASKSIPMDKPALPVVVGGTMMYLTWLVHGRPDALRPSDGALEKAQKQMSTYQDADDWQGAVDKVGALGQTYQHQIEKLCGRDWYRLRRILEVAYTVLEKGGDGDNNNNNKSASTSLLTDKLYSGEREGGLASLGFDVRCFFLCPDERMQHSKVIDERCEQMLLRGLVEETSDLLLTGKLPDMASKAIGYRQTLDYLQRDNAKDNDAEAFRSYLEDFSTATRRYSKKQMQWFRKDDNFIFVPISLGKDKSERTAAASKEIQRLLDLSREEFDKERVDESSISAETRRLNEAQGKKMKTYQYSPQILTENSKELEVILKQVDDCTNRVQAKKPRR